MGTKSTAHFGTMGHNKNFNPTQNDGANSSFIFAVNSDSISLLKQSGSILKEHFTLFCIVNRIAS